jgi:hypothetical protein
MWWSAVNALRLSAGQPVQNAQVQHAKHAHQASHDCRAYRRTSHAARAPISHCLQPNAGPRLTYPDRPESAPTQDPWRQGSGLTLAAPQEDRIQHQAVAVLAGRAACGVVACRHERLDHRPGRIGTVRRITGAGIPARLAGAHTPRSWVGISCFPGRHAGSDQTAVNHDPAAAVQRGGRTPGRRIRRRRDRRRPGCRRPRCWR